MMPIYKREIKFRAWDTSQNKMLDYLPASGGNNRLTLQPANNRYVILQYTGLKDKNGIDIYEGDIIESTILGVKFRGEVVWDTACFRVTKDDLDITLGNDKESKRKVVGNIYENPELLK